jgi:hypothetical protein
MVPVRGGQSRRRRDLGTAAWWQPPFSRLLREGGIGMEYILDKCSPVFFIGGLIDPILWGAVLVNGGGGHAFKKEL